MRALLIVTLAAFGLAGCVPGHTHDPAEAQQPISVTFYAGHVLAVQQAAIGLPEGGVGITAGPAPGFVAGLQGGTGYQPESGRAGVAVLGVGVGPGVESPASALDYTIAVDSPDHQIVQITQYVLPEDCAAPGFTNCAIGQGQPVVLRVINNHARVERLAFVPPQDQCRILHTDVPLGAPEILAAPPILPPSPLSVPILGPGCYAQPTARG